MIFGSFFNVVIYRVPLEKNIAKGRSFCPKCSTSLKAPDLIPVFSQLFLKNRCRYCKEKISLRYPAVELITGLLWLLSYLIWGLSWEFTLHTALWSMLLITALMDFDHMIIVDQVLIFFSLFAAAYAIFSEASLLYHIFGFAAGFLFYLLIYLAARLIYKREAFGFGDVLLMGSAGLFLGLGKAVVASLVSFYVSLIVIIIMMLAGKKKISKLEIPFGPHICTAVFITSLFGDVFLDFYFSFF
jgi:leader peptidase (prepilin peptidase)/N-methyltransferase